MERYTIYCTEEQTKKALELGAPLIEIAYPRQNEKYIQINHYRLYRIPTAEQMIGWLEERDTHIDVIRDCGVYIPRIQDLIGDTIYDGIIFKSHKESTLATIDSALDYLIKNKK